MVFHRENKSSPFLIIDRPGNSTRYSILDEINQAKLILEPINYESNYGPKNTSGWVFYVSNASYYQAMNFGQLEIIYGFKISICVVVFNPFLPAWSNYDPIYTYAWFS